MTTTELKYLRDISAEMWEIVMLFNHLFTQQELDSMCGNEEALLKASRRVVEEVKRVKARHDFFAEAERKAWESARKMLNVKERE